MILLSYRQVNAYADDFSERHEREGAEIVRQFLSGKTKLVNWRKVPIDKLKRLWAEHAKYGFVRDEAGLNDVAESILDGIARLQFSTEVMGHEAVDPKEVLESIGYDFSDKQVDKLGDFLTDKNGNFMLSDYGLRPLLKLYPRIQDAPNAESKLTAIDMALNVAHQRSDLAEFFVEGGSQALAELKNQNIDEPDDQEQIQQYAGIRFSKRDEFTQQWIDNQLSQREDEYTYYKDISGEKILRWIHEDIKNATENAVKSFKQKIRLYSDIQVTYGKNIGGTIARYLSGSATNVPIILLGVDNIIKFLKKDAKDNSVDNSKEGIQNFIKREIYPAVTTSIYHEL